MFPPSLPVTPQIGARCGWRMGGSPMLEFAEVDSASSIKEVEVSDEANLTSDELLQSFNYLEKDGLTSLTGIGDSTAEQIIAQRERIGYFLVLEDLLSVSGIGYKKFELLVGRPPEEQRQRLHRLIRMEGDMNITMRHLQPLLSPAPGIEEIWFLPRAEALSKQSEPDLSERCIDAPVYSWKLLFILKHGSSATGRSSYLIKELPAIMRKIYNERSIATAH